MAAGPRTTERQNQVWSIGGNKDVLLFCFQTHANICSQTRERKPYDVAMMRVAGTEAEELVKAGTKV